MSQKQYGCKKSHILYLGCCSYRHPNTEIEKFYQYIHRSLTKITKEKEIVFCMGDQFHVNILSYNIHFYTNHIDNIFSNNTVHEAKIRIIIPNVKIYWNSRRYIILDIWHQD